MFPHDAISEDMVKDKDSRFGEILVEEFQEKDRDKVDDKVIERFDNKPFWLFVLVRSF